MSKNQLFSNQNPQNSPHPPKTTRRRAPYTTKNPPIRPDRNTAHKTARPHSKERPSQSRHDHPQAQTSQPPSRDGTVFFIDKAFSKNLASGGVNAMRWLSYLVIIAAKDYALAVAAEPGQG
ncbi:hypothetical protein CSB20_05505 [bacterium DOLZORAL124_64_63]|nr:MAG: hypothetical protein CSB20_05505 [bacterium DOLZORAL124_64_63]